MKRSPGQGRPWAATTGPARQTTASWSSRQLGRFAGAIGSPPRRRVVLAAGAPGGLDHSAGSLSSRPDRRQRSGDQGISSDVAADSDPVTAVGKIGAGLAPSHVSAADLTAVLAAARSARLRLPHRLACQALSTARSPTFRFQAGYIRVGRGSLGLLSPLLSVAVDGVRGVPWMTSGQQSFDPGQALVELGEGYLAPVSRGGQRRNAATRVHLPSSPRHQAGTSVAARRPRTGRYEYRHHSRPTLVAGVNNRRSGPAAMAQVALCISRVVSVFRE